MESATITAKMKKTVLGVNDGDVYPKKFEEGKTYHLGESLFETFKTMGVVERGSEEDMAHVDPESEGDIDFSKLEALSKPELLEIASKIGAAVTVKMKAAEIITAIQNVKAAAETK